jgi:hypothetical protein
MSMKKLLFFSRQLSATCKDVCNIFSIPESRKPNATNRGFALLFAALIAAIVLSLGVSIVAIAIKQVQLSSISRESQYAFYAADSSAECALYWDIRYNYFATSTPALPSPPLPPKCDGQSFQNVVGLNPGNVPTYTITFQMQLKDTGGAAKYCAIVSVRKTQVISANGTTWQTVIHADGYNILCASTGGTSALQRSLELKY